MAKRKNNTEVVDEINYEPKKVLKIIIIMVITLGVFYLLTLGILSKKDSVYGKINSSIQYNKILVGQSFNQKRKEYLVLYYNSKKDDMDTIHTLISNYNDKKDKIFLYTVDMSEAFNKQFISDESNTNPTTAEELIIAGVTLIHFKDNKVLSYVTDDIENYLK
ncbi:MAG: hypothetical protein ILA19_04040 [Bacilli bacterium]|nr:hypothetical protein [Bacilli bacterium]